MPIVPFLHCFFGSKKRHVLAARALSDGAPAASQTKPRTRPSISWQAAGLAGVDEVVEPPRARYPLVQDGWDTVAQQRVIVKRYGSSAVAREEIALTQNLDHPNVVHATRLALLPRSSAALTVMPLAPGQPLAMAGVLIGFRRVLFDCLDGLAHIHRQGVVHNDLHHENIITDGQSGYIIDFDASMRSTASYSRHTDVAKLLGCFAVHIPNESHAAFARFCASRLIRRWGHRVPDHAQLYQHAFFNHQT